MNISINRCVPSGLSSQLSSLLFACVLTLVIAGAAAAQDPTDPNEHRPAPAQPAKPAKPADKKPAEQKPAEKKPAPRPAATSSSPERKFRFAGFAEFGDTWFTASKSFDAILDKSSGAIVGGGGQVVLWNGIFAQVDVSHFSADGERAYVFNNQVYKLGIPATVETTPIDISGGYRFRFGRRPVRTGAGARAAHADDPFVAGRLVPYVGGGIGFLKYKETSQFAQQGDNVNQTFTSYNFLAGVEVGVWRFVGAGVEFHQRWVPDGLGSGGVSKAFNETDLGGSTFRVKVLVGF